MLFRSYDRAGLRLSDAQKAAFEAEGRRPHWRFKLEGKRVAWEDLARGHAEVDTASMSDPVLIREDGLFLYTLPSVVDDIDMAITHIIRGEDHVTNTGAQIEIFEALGATVPGFAHMPLLVGADGAALSKRLVRLEERLCVRLINRTTRRLALTPAGRDLHEALLPLRSTLQSAEERISGRHALLGGPLRIAAPTSFGRMHVAPCLPGFMNDHPDVALSLDLSDEFVDLLDGSCDFMWCLWSLHSCLYVSDAKTKTRFQKLTRKVRKTLRTFGGNETNVQRNRRKKCCFVGA